MQMRRPGNVSSRLGTVAKGMAVTVVASTAAFTVGVGAAHADPTWEPDPNAASPYGNVQFYDATGAQIYGGSDLTHIADYALATTDGDPSVDGGAGAKATLYFANPTPGQATGNWPTGQASSSTAYPNASAPGALGTSTHPLVSIAASSGNLASFISGHTVNTDAGYANIYQVRVQDIGPNGGSGSSYWETDIQVDPNAGTWTQVFPAAPQQATPPGAPSLSSATPGNKSVSLAWTAGSGSGVDDYRVSYTTGGGTPTVVDLSSTNTTFTVSGLTNGTPYTFQVAAHNAGGWSADSNSIDATAGGVVTGLTVAPGLTAVGTDHHASVNTSVTWDAASVPASASGVRLCLQPSAAAAATYGACTSGVTQDVASGVSQATFSGLASGVDYRVVAWPSYNGTDGGGSATQVVAGSTLSNAATQLATYGTTLTLVTKLTQTGTTTPLASQAVQLWRKPAGSSAWALVTARTTSSTGFASYALKQTINTVYEWRYGGAAGHMATTRQDRVLVGYAVTNILTKPKVVHGTSVHIYGTVAPAAHYALVYLQKNGHVIAKLKITLRKLPNGKKVWGFDFVFKPTAKGKYKLRVYKPATSRNAAGYGRTLVLTAT